MKSTHKCATAAISLLSSVALGPLMLASPTAAAVQPNGLNCTALAQIVINGAGNKLNPKNNSPVVNPSSGTSIATFQGFNSANPVLARIISGTGTAAAYCQVVFQLNSGPNVGDAMTIEVGLPLNANDGGTGTGVAGCNNIPAPPGNDTITPNNSCYAGNWNGRIESIGNGGEAGSVSSVTSATNAGFVGASSDDGHSTNWCNATNPTTGQQNGVTNCGTGGGGFTVNPTTGSLNLAALNDFIDTAITNQTKWAQTLAQYYYGSNFPLKRTYWNGCSTGGRQGFDQAMNHPDLYDGILAGAPAYHWDQFMIAENWPVSVVAAIDPTDCNGGTADPGPTTGCNAGVTTAMMSAFTYANAKAVSACDTLGSQGLGNDLVADGVVNEPRYCTFDATTLIGTFGSPMTSPMTALQAQAINAIWDGPRNQSGQRLWAGVTYGAPGSSYLGGPATAATIFSTYTYYWLEQMTTSAVTFDIVANINASTVGTVWQQSTRKFSDTDPSLPGWQASAATDIVNLGSLISHAPTPGSGSTGTKLLHYRGLADQLIYPFNSWLYETKFLNLYGAAAVGPGGLTTNGFYSFLPFPGNGHCASNTGFPNAGNMNATDLFNALISWVENGTYPSTFTAYTGANDTGNSTLICAYPNSTRWNGSGPTTSASSYTCVPPANPNAAGEDTPLAAYDLTAPLYHEAP